MTELTLKMKIMEQDVNEPTTSEVSGIIITNEDDYIPENVKLRSRISARILTVDFILGDFEKIKSDGKVVSISLSEKIPLQKYNQE